MLIAISIIYNEADSYIFYKNLPFQPSFCFLTAIATVMFINCANIPKTHQKHSSDYDEYTCPRRCSEAYYPLCGINQAGDTKVFVNDCYMSMENCNQLAQQGMQDVFLLFYLNLIEFKCSFL